MKRKYLFLCVIEASILLGSFTLFLSLPFADAYSLDINATDHRGNTALIHAATQGHKDIVELLIAKGADTQVKNHQGETALDAAGSNGHKGIVKLLTYGTGVNTKGGPPDHNGLAQLLIDKGANANIKERSGGYGS